jgi:hypothetical protein
MSLIASERVRCGDIWSNDGELLQVWTKFRALEAEINSLLDVEDSPSTDPLERLHGEWLAVCSRAVQLPAQTCEEFHAKAAMLIEIFKVATGSADGGATIHWRLAASLARDVLEQSSYRRADQPTPPQHEAFVCGQ